MATKKQTARRRNRSRRAGVSVPGGTGSAADHDAVLTVENSDDYALGLCSRYESDGTRAAAVTAALSGSNPQ